MRPGPQTLAEDGEPTAELTTETQRHRDIESWFVTGRMTLLIRLCASVSLCCFPPNTLAKNESGPSEDDPLRTSKETRCAASRDSDRARQEVLAYARALRYRRETSDQSTTFHQFSMYSGRRF